MGAFLLFVVLTIGFIYTSRDLEARYKQKKSTNWESYSHMALWGFIFWGAGTCLVAFFWLFLAIVSVFLTTVGSLFSDSFQVTWHTVFYHWTIVETNVPLVLSLVFGGMFAWAVTEAKAKKTKSDPQARLNVIEKIAASDNIQLLLIESTRHQLRVMLTLKSRKVYIGFIKQFAHEQVVPGDEDIVIIPLISGYRDKDTLKFHESHSYVTLYDEQGIGTDTEPLSLDDFRVVVPREQIESVSLFDPKTYVAFQNQTCDGAERLANGSTKPKQD
ncbi:hypothetical protein [Aeromonas caviae]|uniref:hypothetical protein n=1 Tax=Aeromonas caviae TaxID=648 RepID=UPI00191EA745|nr:hypothetical protein [Aeromonas caviae]MBL0450419.1 hypothetical protein [Aeromonas caviae]